MTDPRGRHPFAVAAWLLVGAVVVATGAGILGGILSKSLVVDLVAMWPLFALLLMLGIIGWIRGRKKQRRAGAILPLAVFSALVLAVAVHLGGWDQLPSSEARLTGPPVGELSDPTLLTVQIVGDLEVGPVADGSGYRVEPLLRGGLVGVPEATEISVDGDLSVRVSAAEAPSWYTFSGWSLGLSTEVGWRLIFNGTIDADLTTMTVESAAMAGSGVVRLGTAPPNGGSLIVAGDFRVIVPPDSSVQVRGEAEVPPDWETTEAGARSPTGEAEASRWTIDVQGDAPARVVEG